MRPARPCFPAQGPPRRLPSTGSHAQAPPTQRPSFLSALRGAPGQQLLPDRSLPQCPRPFSTFAAAPRPATASRWLFAAVPLPATSQHGAPAIGISVTAPWPAISPTRRRGQQYLRQGAAASNIPARRPSQQQTSSGGE